MMIESVPWVFEGFVVGIAFCILLGWFFSIPRIWNSLFPYNKADVYLKAGEYGESAGYPHPWSPFQEPANAWTSLAYTVVGVVMLCVGVNDYLLMSDDNRVSKDSAFSVLYGLSCCYLGIASFLFHASHYETWRKADAGMTSGSLVAPLILELWDRVPPPSVSALTMVGLAFLLQLSFTHGYLPYGSSDILVPAIILTFYFLELHPRWGGVVDTEQYRYWIYSLYITLVSFLMRLADIRQKVQHVFNIAIRGSLALSAIMCFIYGPDNLLVLIATACVLFIWRYPSRGHIFWHIGGSYGLFIWWFMLRTRPGNPAPVPAGGDPPDRALITIVFFIVIKNAARRLFMNFPASYFPTQVHKDRVFFVVEHLFFAMWGWNALVSDPEMQKEGSSWLLYPKRCWEQPPFPSENFRLYYFVKVATSVEDVLYLYLTKYIFKSAAEPSSAALSLLPMHAFTTSSVSPTSPDAHMNTSNSNSSSNSSNNAHMNTSNSNSSSSNSSNSNVCEVGRKPERDIAMEVHHLATMALTTLSCWCGYTRIGSLVMFLHDISDLPLDLLRLCGLLKWPICQTVSYVLTLLTWAYWRLWWYPTVVLMTIHRDSKSLTRDLPCAVGECSYAQMPERYYFLGFLGTLLVLHIIWFRLMILKGLAELLPSKSSAHSENSNR